MSLNQSFVLRDLNKAVFSFLKAKGSRQINASVYRNPAKVKGGISASPHLINMKEVDQRKVTNKARKIDLR